MEPVRTGLLTASAYEGLPDALLASLELPAAALLERGVASGAIRPCVAARELLVAVALLCQPVPGEERAFNKRLVQLIIEGLRAG